MWKRRLSRSCFCKALKRFFTYSKDKLGVALLPESFVVKRITVCRNRVFSIVCLLALGQNAITMLINPKEKGHRPILHLPRFGINMVIYEEWAANICIQLKPAKSRKRKQQRTGLSFSWSFFIRTSLKTYSIMQIHFQYYKLM